MDVAAENTHLMLMRVKIQVWFERVESQANCSTSRTPLASPTGSHVGKFCARLGLGPNKPAAPRLEVSPCASGTAGDPSTPQLAQERGKIHSRSRRCGSWVFLLCYAAAVGDESYAGVDSDQTVQCGACNEGVACFKSLWGPLPVKDCATTDLMASVAKFAEVCGNHLTFRLSLRPSLAFGVELGGLLKGQVLKLIEESLAYDVGLTGQNAQTGRRRRVERLEDEFWSDGR